MLIARISQKAMILLLASGVALLLFSPASGQTSFSGPHNPSSAAEVLPLALEQLQQTALQNNPTLKQAAATVDVARGFYRQAGLYPNPQLGYLRNDSDQAGATRTSGVFIGQEIVTMHKRQWAQSAESWEIEQGNWNYQSQRTRVLNDVNLRYWDVLGTQELLALIANLEKLAQDNLHASEKLHNAREVPKSDVLQARIQLKTSQLARRESEARYQYAWQQLTAVMGTPQLPPSRVAGSLTGQVPQLNWNDSLARLLNESPQLQAARAKTQQMQQDYHLEKANAIPNVNVQVVVERDHVQQFSTVSSLVSMPIPILNRNQGNIQRAAAQTREAAAEVQRTELALRDQLAEVFQRYTTAKVQVEELESSILPDTKENLEQANKAYRAGQTGYLSVLTGQRMYVETHVSLLESWIELRKTTTEIEGLLLTGGLNPAEVGTALQSTAGNTRRGVLNQLQESSKSNTLPAAVQTGAGP